jgi:hypothetical protein
MTWNAFHRRGEVLRTVIATADARRDGILPMDVDGVAQTFEDDLDVLAALQLRWHTRLAGRIERNLMSQPMNLEASVITAWQETADEMPGVRAIIDHYTAAPETEAMTNALTASAAKEHELLALMSGLASERGDAAARVGRGIKAKAQETWVDPTLVEHINRLPSFGGILDRIRAVIAA